MYYIYIHKAMRVLMETEINQRSRSQSLCCLKFKGEQGWPGRKPRRDVANRGERACGLG